MLFPTPELIIQSLCMCFSAYSQDCSLDDAETMRQIAENMRIVRYSLHSAQYHLDGAKRNIAAHEIVVVTEKWVKERFGFDPDEVMKMNMDYLSCCIAVPWDAWNSYEQLNKTILEVPLLK